MIRRPPRSTRVRSSAASDVYKRQGRWLYMKATIIPIGNSKSIRIPKAILEPVSYTHLRAPRLLSISYAVFCLKKKKKITLIPEKKKQHKQTNVRNKQQ